MPTTQNGCLVAVADIDNDGFAPGCPGAPEPWFRFRHFKGYMKVSAIIIPLVGEDSTAWYISVAYHF